MAFTITTANGGTSATVVGTNSSDAIAAAALANINTIQLTAFDADDAVILGTTALSGGSSLTPSNISLGQGDDLLTASANITAAGSLIDLGEGADTFNVAGGTDFNGISIKGFGGLDTINLGAVNLTNSFLNGNVGTDRFTIGGVVISTTIAGGSEDDVITINSNAAATDMLASRANGQNGDDTITVVVTPGLVPLSVNEFISDASTIFGGQGNDILTTAVPAPPVGPIATSRVVFSGDLGNDNLTGFAQAVDIRGDVLFGGEGNDTFNATGGADTMTGGNGVDTFVFPVAAYTTAAFAGAGTSVTTGDIFTVGTVSATGPANFNNRTATITDFGSSDVLNTLNGTNAASAIGATIAAGNIGVAGTTYKFAGVYDGASSTFTVTDDNLGTDTLLLLDGGVNTASNFVLLRGTSASSLVPSNFV